MTKNTQLGNFAEKYNRIYSENLKTSEKALIDCFDHYGGAVRNDDVCLTVTDGGTKDVNGIDISTNLIINDGLLKFVARCGKNMDEDKARNTCNSEDKNECIGVGVYNGNWRCLNLDQSTGNPLSSYSNSDLTRIDRLNTSITYEDLKNHVNEVSYSATVDTNFYDDYLDFRTSMGNIQLDENNKATHTSDVLENNIKPAFETTKNTHKEVKELRNELDNKMRELYGEKGDPDLNLDSSVYSTMLFTIMTTSLLYYLFAKM